MRLDNPEVKEKFNSLRAVWTPGINEHVFFHPDSNVMVGGELHKWSPVEFLRWYDEQAQRARYSDDLTPEAIAHLVSMAKGVCHGARAS